MAGNDLSGIIIPINVLGYIIKNGSKYVTELNPNYKSSIAQKLGKDATPIPFNKNLWFRNTFYDTNSRVISNNEVIIISYIHNCFFI